MSIQNKSIKLNRPLKVNADDWQQECRNFKSKSRIGIYIIILISLLVSLITGLIIMTVVIPLCLFMFVSSSKKFAELQGLESLSIKAENSKLIFSNYNTQPTFSLDYEDIRNINQYNWGIELESKDRGKFNIPIKIENFEILNEYLQSKVN